MVFADHGDKGSQSRAFRTADNRDTRFKLTPGQPNDPDGDGFVNVNLGGIGGEGCEVASQ